MVSEELGSNWILWGDALGGILWQDAFGGILWLDALAAGPQRDTEETQSCTEGIIGGVVGTVVARRGAKEKNTNR